jgi:hypothetical protein
MLKRLEKKLAPRRPWILAVCDSAGVITEISDIYGSDVSHWLGRNVDEMRAHFQPDAKITARQYPGVDIANVLNPLRGGIVQVIVDNGDGGPPVAPLPHHVTNGHADGKGCNGRLDRRF